LQKTSTTSYKYYKATVFAKFAIIGPHLFMVFKVAKAAATSRLSKWAILDDSLAYLGNRFDHEYRYPEQHEFKWKRTTREMQRRGRHPHISIDDRVFVETVGGDLTIKVEDNTASGHGVYAEAVDNPDQTLDDAEFYFADLGNLIVLKIRPYQEKQWRYLIFNEKMQEALRVDSLDQSCVLLPDDQGIIFSNGYYLQTGEYKIFDNAVQDLQFEKRIASTNGEDFLYMFYSIVEGAYVLLPYNLVAQKVDTPIICNGFSIFTNGELCYFRAEDSPSRHHVVQVWQTPYGEAVSNNTNHSDTYLFKVGNKDLVRGMAECNELLTLLNKGDDYGNLYVDLVRKANEILDSYYWITHQETPRLDVPLAAIKEAAASAIDEFEKVRRIRENTRQAMQEAEANVKGLLDKIRRHKPQQVDQYVAYLGELRTLVGTIIGLKELRYVDLDQVARMEETTAEKTDALSQQCVEFLLKPESLKPYEVKVEETRGQVEAVTKVAEANETQERIDAIGNELQLLIEIVSNLKIEDATQTTQIIDNISDIYTRLNGLRATLKRKRKELLGAEASAEFNAQIKLLQQGVINYLDLCDTPEKCEEYLTKLMIQLEELEGKFSEFEEFILQIGEKREEVYNAFETRRLSLIEARNKRASALQTTADRILKGIQNRLNQFKEVNEINAYFASDLMIGKVRDIIGELEALQDSIKAGDVQARLKTLKEDAVRQLKDRTELFVEGENVIKLGRHAFSVNVQVLDLTIVPREGEMYYHLTGTNFFAPIEEPEFLATRAVWDQSLPSENRQVYRAEYLAYQILQSFRSTETISLDEFLSYDVPALEKYVRDFMSTRYAEGYVKGIHDHDAALILQALASLQSEMDLLRYAPDARALAALYWHSFIAEEEKELLQKRLKGAGVILQLFPTTQEFGDLLADLEERLHVFTTVHGLMPESLAGEAAEYLFQELTIGDKFVISGEADALYKAFLEYLKRKKFTTKFRNSISELKDAVSNRFELIRSWVHAFVMQEKNSKEEHYVNEVAVLLFTESHDVKQVVNVSLRQTVTGLAGEHAVIKDGRYDLDFHAFVKKLGDFEKNIVPRYEEFSRLKKELTEEFRRELRLNEFQPRVLSSFVRNKLIDEVYLPLFGDNLAKQIGALGENKRTDRQGLLLLISPPGYGKTTLMEYIANRLGLIFMKVNGPAIGHSVLSLDPQEAPNAAAREELQKLNLALEMGDNIMLYLDDIQHCNPEFLQKFISLCDAQRKIEGVYRGQPKTYDLRGKRVCVVMAGNPYTESGDKFQIPDMLANRADTYNLGDIIGDTAHFFELSLIENCLSSNVVLQKISQRGHKDIHAFLQIAESDSREGIELEGNYAPEDVNEIVAVLRKLIVVRDVVLKVNQEYIRSAGMGEEFRNMPAFKLQGSYRDMNKLAEKIIPIMNDKELMSLIVSHYENESQTLTTGAEANLLQFKMANGFATAEDQKRWEEIMQIYQRNKALSGDRLAQLVKEMGAFSEGLMGIRNVLEKGIENGSGQ
jgi:hypothetical protein